MRLFTRNMKSVVDIYGQFIWNELFILSNALILESRVIILSVVRIHIHRVTGIFDHCNNFCSVQYF